MSRRPASTSDAPGASRWIEPAFLVAGLLLLAYLLSRLGVAEVWRDLRGVGWGIGLVVLQELLAYAANSVGWYLAFTPPRPRIAWLRLLEARIIGDALNYLTPTAGLGGEVVRARRLAAQAPMTAIAASVSIAKLSQFAGQTLFLVLGLAWVLPTLELPANVRQAALVGLGLFSFLVMASIVAQRRGLFAPLLRAVRRLGWVRQHAELVQRIAGLDAEIARYHLDGSAAFFWSAIAFALGWACGLVEVALLLWLLDVPATWTTVLAIEVLSVVIDSLLFFVPAKAGTQEAGKVLIFTLLGLDPATGLSFGLLRRVRELTWAAIGLGLLRRVGRVRQV